MKKALVIAMALAAAVFTTPAAPASAGTPPDAAMVTHYSWHGSCDCFGDIVENGVHVTNTHFSGTDDGLGDAVGGRDNYTGTVSVPPDQELVFSGPTDGSWCSDYDGQCTDRWTWTIEPDATMYGWAIYPAG